MCILGYSNASGYINSHIEHFEDVMQLGLVNYVEGEVLTNNPLDDHLIEDLPMIHAACSE